MRVRRRLASLCLWAALPIRAAGPAPAAPPALAPRDAPVLRVTLLGTGNPRPTPERSGPATLVEALASPSAPPTRILVDAGRGTAERLFTAGGRDALSVLHLVLLTHLHSDHVVGLPDVWLTGWLFGRSRPLVLRGPAGTASMMAHLKEAFAFDVVTRRDLDERLPGEGAEVDAADVAPDAVLDVAGVKVTPFLVDHGPVKPAYGYRIDFMGRSVVLSGDTRPSANLIAHAKGCDLLVHEVIAADVERRLSLVSEAATRRVLAHHTTAEEAGEVFAAVGPRLAVCSHVVPSPATAKDVEVPARTTYAGPLVVGEDLMVITVGEKVEVRRPGGSR